MQCEVAVIGAGIVGAATAERLRSAGYDVCLIDRSAPGAQASYGNAARIATEHIDPLADPDLLRTLPTLLRPSGPVSVRLGAAHQLRRWLPRYLAACNRRHFEDGARALAGLCGRALQDWSAAADRADLGRLIQRTGACTVFETDRARRAGQRDLERLRELGVRVESASAEAVYAGAGQLRPGLKGALVFPDTAHVSDPHGLVLGLVSRFEALGGRRITADVTRLSPERRGVSIEGPDFSMWAHQSVVSAGAWSGAIAASFGRALPLIAERGYHVDLPYGENSLERPVTSAERRVVLTPLPERLRVTGMVELATPDLKPDWSRCRWLVRHAEALLPGVGDSPLSRWMGSRPTLPDYLPAIGRDPRNPTVIWATGHQHLGLTLAATTAELVAEILQERPSSLDLRPFSPSRFSR